MAGGISLHCADVSSGYAMTGMQVEVYRVEGDERVLVGSGKTEGGILHHPMEQGEGVTAGLYEVVFHVGEYYRGVGLDLPKPHFMEVATYPFGLANEEEHYHLPLKMTPWGFSLFRGN